MTMPGLSFYPTPKGNGVHGWRRPMGSLVTTDDRGNFVLDAETGELAREWMRPFMVQESEFRPHANIAGPHVVCSRRPVKGRGD